MLLKSIVIIIVLVVIALLGYFGKLDPLIKDWRRTLRHAMWYMTAMGIGLHIYWLYLFVTNI